MLDEELDEAILGLIDQWNIAEQRIKRAEQVRANEIVAPAIFELRYAGRKIIDSLEIVLKHGIDQNLKNRRIVSSFIADATEDCVKAKHDAIDAMMNFVTTWFDNIENQIGVEELQSFFPKYLDVLGKIAGIQERIADSRKDRNNLRDTIYNRIDSEDYDEILNLHLQMKTSQARVTLAINNRKKKEEAEKKSKAEERSADRSDARRKSVKDDILKYFGLILGMAGWITLGISQYRQSSFPFDGTIWRGAQEKSAPQALTPNQQPSLVGPPQRNIR